MTTGGYVVKDFFISNTRIKVCDDYCRGTTSETVQAILARIADRAHDQLTSQAVKD